MLSVHFTELWPATGLLLRRSFILDFLLAESTRQCILDFLLTESTHQWTLDFFIDWKHTAMNFGLLTDWKHTAIYFGLFIELKHTAIHFRLFIEWKHTVNHLDFFLMKAHGNSFWDLFWLIKHDSISDFVLNKSTHLRFGFYIELKARHGFSLDFKTNEYSFHQFYSMKFWGTGKSEGAWALHD